MMENDTGKAGRDLKTEGRVRESRLYSKGTGNSFKKKSRFLVYKVTLTAR